MVYISKFQEHKSQFYYSEPLKVSEFMFSNHWNVQIHESEYSPFITCFMHVKEWTLRMIGTQTGFDGIMDEDCTSKREIRGDSWENHAIFLAIYSFIILYKIAHFIELQIVRFICKVGDIYSSESSSSSIRVHEFDFGLSKPRHSRVFGILIHEFPIGAWSHFWIQNREHECKQRLRVNFRWKGQEKRVIFLSGRTSVQQTDSDAVLGGRFSI